MRIWMLSTWRSISHRLVGLSVKRPALALGLIGMISLLLGVLLIQARDDHQLGREAAVQTTAAEQASSAAQAIDALLVEVQQTGDDIIRRLNSGEITPESAPEVIASTLEAHRQFWGVGIVYDPNSATAPADPNHYFTRPGGLIAEGGIAYDYADPGEARGHWWRHAYEEGGAWIPPYLGGTSSKMVALYAAPFFGPDLPSDGSPAGVVLVSIQLDTLNRDVGWSELGGAGYGFVVSRSGSYIEHPSSDRNGGFIAHPVKAYWRGADVLTFPEIALSTGNTAALQILDPVAGDGRLVLDYEDEVTGRPAWLFYEPIPTADWVLGFVAIKEVVLAGDETDFHYKVWIGLALVNALALFAAALVVGVLQGSFRLWTLAAVLTLAPAVGIGLIWTLVLDRESEPIASVDGTNLRSVVDTYNQYVASVAVDLVPETVLAGVFLEAIGPNQDGGDNWDISGTVWQRYSNGVPEGEEPGFIFLDAVQAPVFEPSHDVQDGGTRTIGWRFSATIRPQFDRSRYPFDEILLTVRMVHRQVDKPIVLLPDVGEYDLIVPTSRPGLAPEVDVRGFAIQDSYFGYTTSERNSTLGIPNFSRQIGAPELTFTVRMGRNFLDPFISQMLPLIVVAGLLFAVHLMSTRPGEWAVQATSGEVPEGVRQRAWGGLPTGGSESRPESERGAHSIFYTQATLTSVLGLMFVSILSHNGLRSSLIASEIIYLEYAYFIVYGALLVVALNSLLFSAGRGGVLIHWRNNLIAELAYWPVVATSMFVATLWVFY